MRRRRVLVFVAGAVALLGAGCAQAAPTTTTPMPSTTPVSTPAAAVRAAGLWGRAIEVPGLAALNQGRNAGVSSVSCPSPGNCAAGGYYRDGGGHQQGFVVSERNGRWGQAIEVPGLAALSKGGNAEVRSVSCASPGSCAAGGAYTDGNGHQQGFVAVERIGVWLQAVEVPGLAALSKGGNPDVPVGVSSVSCASPGSCAAGGDYYTDASGKHAFVVSEVNGSWGTAQQVAENLGRGAAVNTVSCGSGGNCSAGGCYGGQAFVVSEVNGTWAAAQEVAGSLNTGGFGWVASVSCAPAGNCSAGGAYDYGGYNAPFVVSEKNGVWGQAIDVPGLVTRDAWISSVSCAPAGSCVAGGSYPEADRHISIEGFVT